jgi:hypothetical protein
LQANEERKLARNLEHDVEARRVALEERIAANEERRLVLEEKKVANEEHQRLVEEERKLFFMDTSNMDERQKVYINLARDEVLAKIRMVATNMNAPSAGYGGYVGMGAPAGVFGASYGGMGAPAGMFGGGMGGMAGMGGMGSMASMGGMGLGGFRGVFGRISAPMASMGGMGAPPGVSMEPWEHHREDLWPPWILLYLLQLMVPMKKKQKMEMTLKIWMSDGLFAFVICKFVLNFVRWI